MKLQPRRNVVTPNLARTHDQDPVHPPVHDDTTPYDWGGASQFPQIEKRPGMEQKWVRTHVGPDPDEMNVQKAIKEGWKPRMVETVPGYNQPPMPGARFDGCVCIPGMVLMEMPEEVFAQKIAYFQGRTQQLTEAVDRDILRVQSDRVPFSQQRTGQTRVGKQAHIADDD